MTDWANQIPTALPQATLCQAFGRKTSTTSEYRAPSILDTQNRVERHRRCTQTLDELKKRTKADDFKAAQAERRSNLDKAKVMRERCGSQGDRTAAIPHGIDQKSVTPRIKKAVSLIRKRP
ncbi:hypothetical protein [Rhodopirellula sp. MGV]|uniref:hypothetical protein n=1 Tax=Rhodopirellula sp. MGV TaxID=2023130 RepID=UPI000BD61188|nr:hypothetical protein [Rhodopirellula sp. MGV]OYP34729.1 hypothetical protein CGZ80_13955 [Rhodopirellula sp. MGV]